MEVVQTIAYAVIGFLAALALILTVVLLVVGVQILRTVRRITDRVDDTTASFSQIIKYSLRKGGPAAASAVAAVVLRSIKRKFK